MSAAMKDDSCQAQISGTASGHGNGTPSGHLSRCGANLESLGIDSLCPLLILICRTISMVGCHAVPRITKAVTERLLESYNSVRFAVKFDHTEEVPQSPKTSLPELMWMLSIAE